MIDTQEPNRSRTTEIGLAAKSNILDFARQSGFFDSRYSYPLTYKEVEVKGQYGYLPATILTFDGILSVNHREAAPGELPRVGSLSEIPATEYIDFEPLVRAVVQRDQ